MNNEDQILEMLTAMQSNIVGMRSDIGILNSKVDSLETKVDKLTVRVDSLETKVDKLAECATETRAAVNYVAEWVENVSNANPKLHKLRP